MTKKPLTEAIQALTKYANEITHKDSKTLSEAVDELTKKKEEDKE